MESFEVFLKTYVSFSSRLYFDRWKLMRFVFARYTESITLPSTPTADDYANGGLTENEYVYIDQIKAMRHSEITTLYVDFSHLLERDDVLARAIGDQYYR